MGTTSWGWDGENINFTRRTGDDYVNSMEVKPGYKLGDFWYESDNKIFEACFVEPDCGQVCSCISSKIIDKGMCGSCKLKKSFLFLFDYRRAEDPLYTKDEQRGPVAFIPCPCPDHGPPLQWEPMEIFEAAPGCILRFPQGDSDAVPRRVPGTSSPPGPAGALLSLEDDHPVRT